MLRQSSEKLVSELERSIETCLSVNMSLVLFLTMEVPGSSQQCTLSAVW